MLKRTDIRIIVGGHIEGFLTFIKNIADSLNVIVFADNQGDEGAKGGLKIVYGE